jgi:hypothetical protein
MDTQISLLSNEALDGVSGGLAISAATNPGRYGTKLPPLPNSAPGNQSDGWWNGLILGGFAIVGVLAAG